MIRPEQLYASPNALAPHYRRFDVANRLLLTGHSHQAWPDRAFEGQSRAWIDAAKYVDEKWELAFGRAERVRRGYARLLGDQDGEIALAANTHDLRSEERRVGKELSSDRSLNELKRLRLKN